MQALFSPESIQSKRNTEAIEVGAERADGGPHRRIQAGRAAAVRRRQGRDPPAARSRKAASELAQKAGREKLALLEQGKSDKEAGVAFGKPVDVLRSQPQPGFTPEALTRVFQADADKLPAYIGAPNERGGFSIYKLVKVVDAAGRRRGEGRGGTREDRRAARSRELFDAYVASLKAKADVKINQANLEKK